MNNNELLMIAGGVIVVGGLLFLNKESVMTEYKKFKQRGIRNNNPGNLVKTSIAWQGKVPHSQNTDSRFEQFISPEYGIRAMFIDVRNDIRKGANTVRRLITAYAPPFENNTAAYIAAVAKAIKKAPDDVITSEDYEELVTAIIKQENGVQPYSAIMIRRAIALA